MRKKLILFLMLALFGSTNFLRADVVEIGDATTTTYVTPFNSLWGYSYVEQVYTADEIGMAGTINSISFNMRENETAFTSEFDIFMKNVTRETFASPDDYEAVTAADMVYSGSVTFNEGWTTITLGTPFAYDGTSNLMIGMHEKTSGYSTRYFYYTSKENSVVTFHSDSANPDPLNLGSYGGNKYVSPNRANIQLDITAGGGGGVAGEITVHDGTVTNGNVPVYGFYADAYNKCEMVYPATELAAMNGGDINSLKFYASQSSVSWGSAIFQVFVAEVADATISDFAGPGTVVYEGALSIVGGEMVVNFTTPYHYNGGNLLVGVYQTTTGSYVTSSWYGETVTGASISGYSYSDLSSISATQRNFLPKTTFAYTTTGGGADWTPDYNAPLGDIVIVAPENGQQNIVPTMLKWKNAENAHYYTVKFGSVYGQLETLVDGEEVAGWNGTLKLSDYDITIEPNTRYYWQVENWNIVGNKEVLAVFTSEFDTPQNVRVTADEIFTDESTIVKWTIGDSFAGSLTVHDGTATNGYVPVYGFYADAYLKCEMVYPEAELESMIGSDIDGLKFYSSSTNVNWGAANFQVFMAEAASTSISAFAGPGTVVYEGALSIDANGEMTVLFNTPYTYLGGNLLIGFYNTVTGTYVSCSWNGEEVTGASVQGYSYTSLDAITPTQRNFLPKTTFICGGAKGNRDLLGSNVYLDNVKVNDEVITGTQYTLSNLDYNIVPGHKVTVRGVYDYGESLDSDSVMVKVSTYGTVNGTVKELMDATALAGVNIQVAGEDEFGNAQTYTTTTEANGTFVIDSVKLGEYTITASLADYESYEEEFVIDITAPTYEAEIYLHELYNTVYKVYAEVGEAIGTPVANVLWSFNDFDLPGGTGTGGGSGSASTFAVDFESGMPEGWTVVDANNDGWTWCMTSDIPTTWTYYASLTLDWYHNGTNAICSGSYINGVGALNPDEYLVTPLVNIANGSTFSFYCAATDASYPADHFGVFVSADGNDWTLVQEWTLTAKSNGNNGGMASRNGKGDRLGNWYQKSVDLSAYAGQKYIAIRHFNCYDQYIMCVDDIELTNGSKANNNADECGQHYASTGSRETWDLLNSVTCTSAYQYGVATDGNYIYTSSWSASSSSQFYKYDMDGNFVEEFNVAGSGQIRDLTYDGQYFYGVANSTTIYCLDLANHTLIGTIASEYGAAMRCCGYDSERDGFWVVGNWSGNLKLVDRNGAVQITGPAPTSASGVAYFKDANGVEHVYCLNNGNNDVVDYIITNNTLDEGTVVANLNTIPGANGSSGGCYVGTYGDKVALFGDLQQSPNLIGIYELEAAQGGGTVVSGGNTQAPEEDHYFRIYRKPILLQTMPEEVEAELLADQYGLNFADTLYTDHTFDALEDGIYEYGVQAVYPWMQRSNDNNFTYIVWSNDVDRNMTTTLTINGTTNIGSVAGANVVLTNLNEAAVTFDFTMDSAVFVTDEFRKGNYNVTVSLPGYIALIDGVEVPAEGVEMNLWEENVINIVFEEAFIPAAELYVSNTGFAVWTDMLNVNTGDRAAQRYHVTLDDVFQGETEDNYMMLNTTDLVNGETYTAAVAVIYETGMSDFITCDFVYMDCDEIGSVENLEGTVDLADVTLTWSAVAGNGGTGGGGGGGGTGTGDTFSVNFDDSAIPTGWTTIDGGTPSGYGWQLVSNKIGTGYGHNGSADAIMSQSYDNNYGVVYPDNYLVTSQVNLAAGSTFSFYACGQDASYAAEHVGVFVSDNGTSNWTMVDEWTLSAKGTSGLVVAGRDGQMRDQGNWYLKSVDLSAYAGQKYIAIRHFNCSDQFYLLVDDIELTNGAKNREDVTYDFEDSSLQGWTTIDGGTPSGYGWQLVSNKIGTGYGHNGSADAIMSQSYDNNYGVVYPDNYLISPAKASYSQITLWACGQDASYAAEHFGVAVSTTDPTASAFTMVQEWTIGSKGEAYVGPRGNRDQSTWTQYTVDLGAYNGQEIWVAVRHFNCSDQFYLVVDDITLTTGAGGGGGGGGGTGTTTNLTCDITPNAYNIFVDGELVGATSDTTYVYTQDDADLHNYCVVYVDGGYNFYCESCTQVTADPWGIGEGSIVNAIYPNPTTGNLFINTNAEMKSVNIVNMLGQVVYNKETSGTEAVINMAQFGNGVYMVSIVTVNGTSVQRIIVNK